MIINVGDRFLSSGKEIIKARIKSVNEGNGVIIDFALKNSNNIFVKFLHSRLIQRNGFNVVSLQLSNVKAR